jgi:hypothetical protein
VEVTRKTTRGVLGALSLVGGLTWILLTVGAPKPVTDLIVGIVLVLGGLVLLMPHRVPLPGRVTAAVTAAAAVTGTLAGSIAESTGTGGMYGYFMARGWPSTWLSRGGLADDPATARRVAEQAGWQLDAVSLATDLYFWAFAGLLGVTALVLARRFRT